MNLLMSILLGVGGGVLSFYALDRDYIHKSVLLKPSELEIELSAKRLDLKERGVLSIILGFSSGVTAWSAMTVGDTIQTVKLLVGLLCLLGSGCVDYLEHRIPNIFPLLMSISAILLLAAGYLTGQQGASSYVLGSAATALLCIVAMLTASVLSKGGVGMGDIKILTSLALLGGIQVFGGTLFFATLLCALTAATLLILKKKTWKESLPFGPFLLFGYMLSICLKNY